MDQEQRIKDLEAELLKERAEKDELMLINAKLGYSVKLMTDFHLSLNDKIIIAEAMDNAENVNEIQGIQEFYDKKFRNKALEDEQADFQWSNDFKENLRLYYAVSLGYDPVSKISENVEVVAEYFSFENKVRNTPDGQQRNALVDKLLKMRPGAEDAMNNIINTVNSFNTPPSEDDYED